MKHYILRHALFLAILLMFSSLTAQNYISGIISYHDSIGDPIQGVMVDLYDTDDNIVATTFTDNIGEFIFPDVPSGYYFIRSSATMPIPSEKIDLVDASLVLQYLNGTYSFVEYEYEAADVNGSGNVTHGDYQLLMNKILGRGNAFAAGEWQLEEGFVDFSSRGDTTEREMWGTATGDVEGVWFPGGRLIDVLNEDIYANKVSNNEVELEIRSSYNDLISGFNLNLAYPVDLIEITGVTGPDNNFHFNLDEDTGILKVIWLDESKKPGNTFFGETLFRVTVKQNRNLTDIEEGFFSLLEGGMILDSKLKQVGDIIITLPKVTTTSNKLEFEIVSYPNPVIDNLNLKITSPSNNYASIFIYDLTGRMVQQDINTDIYKGAQLININIENLPSGHYLYKVNLEGDKNSTGRFYKTN